MGNKQSSTYRRVQPSLCYPFKYNQLSPSSCSDNQPLLVNHHNERVEQLQREIERNRIQNESLERRNANLEKDMREFKAAIISQKEHPINTDKKVAALENQLLELKSTISKLQTASSQPVTPKQHKAIGVQKTDELGKPLIDPTSILQLKTTNCLMNNDIATGVQKTEELDKHQAKTTKSAKKQDTSIGANKLDEFDKLLIDLTLILQTKTTNYVKKQDIPNGGQKLDEFDKLLKDLTPIVQTKTTNHAKKQDTAIGVQKTELVKPLIDSTSILQLKTTNYAMNKDTATGVQKTDELDKHQSKATKSAKAAKREEKNAESDKKLMEQIPFARIQDTATEVQTHDELNKLHKGRILIRQTKTVNSVESDCLVAPMEQSYDSINDVVWCLIVLIFLVGILIGINL